jgi:hypothetical protein
MVVFLSVENDDKSAVLGLHGLIARYGKVYDGQSSMSEMDAQLFVGPVSVRVRTAMFDGIAHVLDALGRVLRHVS